MDEISYLGLGKFKKRLMANNKNLMDRSKPLTWGGKEFPSLKAFAYHHGVTPGGLAYYIKYKQEWRGFEINYI